MERLFFILAVIVLLMVLVAGGGVYWLSSAMVAQAREDSAAAVAKAVALSISEQIDLLGRTLDKMTLDPEVLNAVSRADTILLTSVAANLEKHFPDALKIRLLLPGSSEVDVKSVPRMGFADLDMVRETFTANQLPAIQGDNGADRHLAMARRIIQHDKTVGVILASLNYGFIAKSLKAAAVNDGFIELKQAELVLGFSGEKNDTKQRNIGQAKVANTDWDIYYHYDTGTSLGRLILIAGFITIPCLISILALFVVHRRLSGLVTQDLSSIIKAFKDMMTDKSPGSYPVNLKEMNAVISTLAQFKRVLDTDDYGFLDNGEDFKLDDFLQAPDLDANEYFFKEDQLSERPPDTENILKKPSIIKESLPKIHEMHAITAKIDEMSTIFRAYDFCGIAGKSLTRELVYDIARALGTDAKNHDCKTIVIARDGRKSSPLLAEALAQGIASTGCNVLDIGMVPTPVLYFVARHIEGGGRG